MIKSDGYSGEELQRFRDFQRVSFDILETAARDLRPGISEHEATRRLRKAFHLAGAHNYFHVPVALFGDRSAYPGDFGGFEALPTDRVLNEGDTFILDAAFRLPLAILCCNSDDDFVGYVAALFVNWCHDMMCVPLSRNAACKSSTAKSLPDILAR